MSALDHGVALLRESWQSFDDARPHQPPVSLETMGLLESALPEDGIGVRAALDAAGQVLDESLAQTRPRFFGYVGSSGLESAVLADAMAMSHDVNLAAESAAALLVEQQTIGWVGLIGYPAGSGTVTSGGMLSNLTALMTARTRAFPESRRTGLGGVRAAVYASAEAHSSVERAVEVLGLGRDSLRAVPIDARRRMDPAAPGGDDLHPRRIDARQENAGEKSQRDRGRRVVREPCEERVRDRARQRGDGEEPPHVENVRQVCDRADQRPGHEAELHRERQPGSRRNREVPLGRDLRRDGGRGEPERHAEELGQSGEHQGSRSRHSRSLHGRFNHRDTARRSRNQKGKRFDLSVGC